MSLTGALAGAGIAIISLGALGVMTTAITMLCKADDHEDIPRAMWWLLAAATTATITGAALAGAAS